MIRTRFAPSPTGSLHVGNARIAILNWLFTRKHDGAFVLRIEDTDSERNVTGAEAGIREDLLWLGLDWDEGPGRGDFGPYRQSERGAEYRLYAQRLLDEAIAYRCFCAERLVDDDSAEPDADDHDTDVFSRERCACAALEANVAAQRASKPHTLRFRVPDHTTIVVDDVIRGRIEFPSAEIADFVLLRSDGRPTYNFAVVVDDIEMRITHVIRGVGHLSNTPRQALLFDAFEADRPVFAHVPMVLGPDRQKLSKRHGASAMAEYRALGYHPDGVLNYLSLLSWSSPSGDDVLTRERLIAEVSLERVGIADAMFDDARLRWLSSKHIEMMPVASLVAAVRPFVDRERFDLDDERLAAVVAATRTHYATFADVNGQLEAFFHAGHGATTETGRPVISAAVSVFRALDAWTEDALKAAIVEAGATAGVRGRALYEPLRLVLTGREHGPPLQAVLFVQGRERVLEALQAALRDGG